MTETTPRKSAGYLAVLRNRDFAIIWSGKAVSYLGDALRNIALIWLVKEITGSAVAMSTVMLCAMIPYLALGLFAGSLVDLADRKRIMIWTDVGRGLLSLSIPALMTTGHLAFWHLCLLALVMSSLSTFFNPALTASIPNVVGKDQLLSANALNSLTWQIAGAAGPALGGAIVGLWGTSPAFAADGVSFLVSAAAIWLARIPGARPEGPSEPLSPRRVLAGVGEGFHFVWARPLILSIVLVALGVNFIFAPVDVLTAVHVDKVWHAGAQGYGLMGSAWSFGVVAGTLLVGWVAARIRRDWLISGGLAALGLTVLGLVFGRVLAHGLATFALAGITQAMINVPLNTWMQEIVPDRVRGRVFSATEVGCQAAVPVALAVSGAACDAFGTRAIFATAAAVTVAGSLALMWVFRVHREEITRPAPSATAGEAGTDAAGAVV